MAVPTRRAQTASASAVQCRPQRRQQERGRRHPVAGGGREEEAPAARETQRLLTKSILFQLADIFFNVWFLE